MDNTHNHGPASQGSETEADACFAKITDPDSLDIVTHMKRQKGGPGHGFIDDKKEWIEIVSLKLKLNK